MDLSSLQTLAQNLARRRGEGQDRDYTDDTSDTVSAPSAPAASEQYSRERPGGLNPDTETYNPEMPVSRPVPAPDNQQQREYQQQMMPAVSGIRPASIGTPPAPPLSTYSTNAGLAQQEAASRPTQEQYAREHRPEGFGARLWSGVKSVAKGFRDHGIPGAVVGGVSAAADKDYEATTDYKRNEQESFHRQKNLYDLAGQEIGLENTVADNSRADQQMQMNQEYHRDTLANSQFNRLQTQHNSDRNYDLSYGQHVLAVQKFIQDMKDKSDKAKTQADKDAFDRKHKAAQMYLDSDTPLPPDLAVALGAPGLTGARKRDPNLPFEVDKAKVGPEAYGGKDWNELRDNPDYTVWHQQALAAAGSEKALNDSIKYGDMKAPPKQIPLYEYAQKNPHPLNAAAAHARGARGGGAGAARSRGALKPGDSVKLKDGSKVKVGKVYGDGTWDPA